MASTVELKNKKTGEKVWRYAVDVREMLAHEGSDWEMTGNTSLNGWATPTPHQPVQRVAPKSPVVEAAEAMAKVLREDREARSSDGPSED